MLTSRLQVAGSSSQRGPFKSNSTIRVPRVYESLFWKALFCKRHGASGVQKRLAGSHRFHESEVDLKSAL